MADDDSDLFREAVKDAKPLKQKRVYHAPKKPRPMPRPLTGETTQILVDYLSDDYIPAHELENGEELLYLRPGQSPDLLRKLRRGNWLVQARLDLHGMLTDEARVATVDFLTQCKEQGNRCVKIIHGKGLSSKNQEPVLKNKIRSWLMQRDEVIAYAQARQADGGGGAVIVLLKS